MVSVVDKVWLIIHDDKGLWYSPPSTSGSLAWQNAKIWEMNMNPGMTKSAASKWKDRMKEDGWRAKRVEFGFNDV